jgi:polar amino acid transport system substrate-binding protein
VRTIADADRAGTRIAVVRHHAMDSALHGMLSNAERVYIDTPDQAFALLRERKVEVLAGIRPGLLHYAGQFAGACVLDDSYGRNVIALAVRKGAPDWLTVVCGFADQARIDGTVRQAIAQAGLAGVDAE